MYGNTSEAQAASYDRNNPAYPYKSHGQWLKAAFGLMACVLILLFNGVEAFLRRPFGVRTFISSYISVSPPFTTTYIPFYNSLVHSPFPINK
jgi:amino acid transporter